MADKNYGLTTVVADPAVSDVDQGQHAHSSRATDRTEKEGLDVGFQGLNYESKSSMANGSCSVISMSQES